VLTTFFKNIFACYYRNNWIVPSTMVSVEDTSLRGGGYQLKQGEQHQEQKVEGFYLEFCKQQQPLMFVLIFPLLFIAIWEAARDTISAWTGQELTQCSLYGIRVYKEGSILSPHVDRLPLVSSAIINVAQDVDEPWPLEVISHSGKAENVTVRVLCCSATNKHVCASWRLA
jgi:prolyl 4-hydroxylase